MSSGSKQAHPGKGLNLKGIPGTTKARRALVREQEGRGLGGTKKH